MLALSPGELWARLPDSPGFGDWEVRPRHSWNYVLSLDPDPADPAAACTVSRFGPTSPPFGLRNAQRFLG